jgi:hypothetical protein
MIPININKAKNIAHDRRRAKAQEMFAPYDRVIELNIPGQEEKRAEAESQRAIIREKDSTCQTAIDASTTTDQIKEALDSFV